MFHSCERCDARRPYEALRTASIVVICLAIVAAAAARKKPPEKPVNLNSATVQQLEQLPGIGPATAKRIVEMREKGGAFRRIEDLLAVRGISEKRLNALRPYLAVSPPPGAATPAARKR